MLFAGRSICVRYEHPKQAVRAHLHDLHARKSSDQTSWCHDLNRLEIWGAACDLTRITACFFEQHFHRAPLPLRIEVSAIAIDHGLQAVKALGLLSLGHLIRHFRRWSAGSGRVFEREGAGVSDLIDKRESSFEIVLGFTGEA